MVLIIAEWISFANESNEIRFILEPVTLEIH